MYLWFQVVYGKHQPTLQHPHGIVIHVAFLYRMIRHFCFGWTLANSWLFLLHMQPHVGVRNGKSASFTNPLADDSRSIYWSEKVPFLALTLDANLEIWLIWVCGVIWRLLSKANSSDKDNQEGSYGDAIVFPLGFQFPYDQRQEDFHMGNEIRKYHLWMLSFSAHAASNLRALCICKLPPKCYPPFVFTLVTLLVKPRFKIDVTPSAGMQYDSA